MNDTRYTQDLPQDLYFIGNKAKGRISKRAFQESKARKNFRKTNIFYLSRSAYVDYVSAENFWRKVNFK